MSSLAQSTRTGLQTLAAKPAQAACALVYLVALAAAGLWAARQALLNPLLPADAPWEALCVGGDIARRKCLVALGGRVHEGFALLAVGGQVQGVVAIGQVAVGLVAIGWAALGAVVAVGVTALSPLVVLGLLAFGGVAPHCVVGATLAKTPRSQGVLNFAFIELSAAVAAGGGRRKAKESPRPGFDDEGSVGSNSEEDESESGRQQLRRRPQASSEDWPYESSRGRYAQGA